MVMLFLSAGIRDGAEFHELNIVGCDIEPTIKALIVAEEDGDTSEEVDGY